MSRYKSEDMEGIALALVGPRGGVWGTAIVRGVCGMGPDITSLNL